SPGSGRGKARRCARWSPTGFRSGSAGFGSRTERVALLSGSASAFGRRRRPPVTQLAQAGLEEGLQPGAVLALERAQLVDLLLQRGPLGLDLPDDLVVLALGLPLEGGGLLASLTFQRLGPGARVAEH